MAYVLNKKFSASKPKPTMILTKIMVRKTSHDLVLTEESWVPCDLITESNMPRRAVIAIIVKIISAKATNSVPNISGIHPCSLSSPFCYCNSYCCNANCSYQVQPSASQNKNRCNHRNNYEEKYISLHFFIHHWFSSVSSLCGR